jgi:hypothetical protein
LIDLVQRVEELNRSTRVINAVLLSIHVVAADIANCERKRQNAGDDGTRFDHYLSNLTKLDQYPRISTGC